MEKNKKISAKKISRNFFGNMVKSWFKWTSNEWSSVNQSYDN